MKTYWFQPADYPNLGDEFTAPLLERMFGITPNHVALPEADLLSTGSVLGWPWSNHNRGRSHVLHIVGSGFLRSETMIDKQPNSVIHSVRGFLSKMKLGDLDSPNVTVGDPGLLLADIAKVSPKNDRTTFGVILHHTKVGSSNYEAAFEGLPVKFLDIRTDDVDGFASEMMSCDVILSESLHGLIFADSLGVPNSWLTFDPISISNAFKYFDYFSSTGRDFEKMLVSSAIDEGAIKASIHTPDQRRLKELREDIVASFESAIAQIERPAGYELGFPTGGGDLTEDPITLVLEEPLRHFRVEFTADLDRQVQFRDVLLYFELRDHLGVRLDSGQEIFGVTPTALFGGGHYRYLDVKPGRRTYVENVWLPADVYCSKVSIVRRTHKPKSIRIENPTLRVLSTT